MTDAAASTPPAPTADDPRLWLEEIEGERALETVRAWNARTLETLQAEPRYAELKAEALAIVNAQDKIPYGIMRGRHVYNFWQDETHVRGVVRRTSLESYLSDAPDWDVLLDVDKLAEADGENWVYQGSVALPPDYERCILTLSRGGKDAAVRREWDHATRGFVEGGFALPESKGAAAWLDIDTLLVSIDWGEGSMTASGYPFVVKRLKRGQEVADAAELIRGEASDVGVWPAVVEADDGTRIPVAVRAITFYESVHYWLPEGEAPVAIPAPRKASLVALFDGQLLITLEEDWTPVEGGPTHRKGALVAYDFEAFRRTRTLPPVTEIIAPGPRETIEGIAKTKSSVLVTMLENVVGAVYRLQRKGGVWAREKLELPENATLSVVSANKDTDTVFVNAEGFTRPSTLIARDLATHETLGTKAAPARFDASGVAVEQHFATSTDGTEIPYFLVRRAGAAMDGATPTLLYGYGGFQVSQPPAYSGVRGKLWLERGGQFALANIRGGGEFGPDWHQAGLKTKRQTVFDDFIAVAEDLIARGATSPRRLGIEGGSNGGLLVGVMVTQRPDLFNAAVCAVPLLDMLRYHTLLAGASWVGEYGDPGVAEERAFLEAISPYHNVDAGKDMPEVFFVTSTKDDRVHPGHARKMAALLEEMGRPFLYYENIDGGHSAAANLKETAKRLALQHVYLMRKLMD